MKNNGLVFVLGVLLISVFVQPVLGQSRDMNIDFMLRGYFYAGSRIVDKDAPGGFAPSENFPKPIEISHNLPLDRLSLVALLEDATTFQKEFRGMKVILANTTNERKRFSASDSRLYILQEALDTDGKWKPVEYLPSSWCGNSYHNVFLDPNEYWEFAAAKFSGTHKTRLRFRLQIESHKQKATFIYSNEFEGSINPKQFSVQKEYTPKGLMDPYNN